MSHFYPFFFLIYTHFQFFNDSFDFKSCLMILFMDAPKNFSVGVNSARKFSTDSCKDYYRDSSIFISHVSDFLTELFSKISLKITLDFCFQEFLPIFFPKRLPRHFPLLQDFFSEFFRFSTGVFT